MRLALFTCYLLLLTCHLPAQVPFAWTADGSVDSAAAPARKDVYRGESVDLRPFWTGEGVSTNGAAFTLYWQTNGMGSAWWGDPTNAFRWTPARDCGAAEYTLFVRCQTAAGASYRANARLRMLFSPGFVPSVLPPPACYPTLAADLLQMLVPSLPTYEAWAAEASARASADAAGSNHVHAVRADLQARIDGIALAGGGSSLFIVDAATNWLVGVSGGAATLYAVSNVTDFSTVMLTFSEDFGGPAGERPPQTSYVWSFGFEDGDWTGQTTVGGHLIMCPGAMWVGPWVSLDPETYYPSVLQVDAGGEGTATGAAYLDFRTYSTTNAVGTYVTSAALAAALAGYNPSAATNAQAVASNAFALAAAAATREQLAAATNALVRLYFVSTNAWIGVDYSNATVSVSMLSPDGATNTVTVGAAEAGIDPEATNLLWQALSGLSSGLAGKADKAWGKYTPGGDANPDPDYMTWLNAPATVFASGCSWSTYGTFAVLTAPGATAWESGGDGAFRLGPDATNYFGYTVGGSVTVGAVPDSIRTFSAGATNGYAEITYAYAGGDFPSLWFAPSLAAPFELLPAPAWSDNLDGSATVTAPATTAKGFFRATTSSTFSSVFVSSMPARFAGGVFGATNAPPVVYDSTITVTSGGHTYRIPAQLAD